jgi:hypothetical protein
MKLGMDELRIRAPATVDRDSLAATLERHAINWQLATGH